MGVLHHLGPAMGGVKRRRRMDIYMHDELMMHHLTDPRIAPRASSPYFILTWSGMKQEIDVD